MGNVRVFFFLLAFICGSLVGHRLNGYEILLTLDGVYEACWLILDFIQDEFLTAFFGTMILYSFYMAVVSYFEEKYKRKPKITKSEDAEIPDWFVQVIDIE